MKTVRLVCCLFLILLGLSSASIPGLALAQEEGTTTENVTVAPLYPTVEAIAGGTFAFQVELSYQGDNPKVFDLQVKAPTGWDVYMTPQYEKDNKISSITLKSSFTVSDTILVNATAPFYPLPDPGDYKIALNVVSDTVKASAELTARVTAKYALQMVPTLELYNTNAKTNKDNYFSLDLGNVGTGAVDNIKFTTSGPEGWALTFQPDKLDKLDAFDASTVQMDVKPPSNTIAGDYYVKVRATGTQTSSDEISIRVTVQTSTIWGWIGVIIILIVVVGLIVTFMRFSRR